MTRGAWLTERVARNTAWLKPYLGIKYSEHASARQNPLEGRFAEKAAAALQRCKTPPHSWNNVLRYRVAACCACSSIGLRVTDAALVIADI